MEKFDIIMMLIMVPLTTFVFVVVPLMALRSLGPLPTNNNDNDK